MKIVAGNKRYTKKYAEGGEIILGGGSTADVQDRILEQGGTLAGNLQTDNIGFAEGGEFMRGGIAGDIYSLQNPEQFKQLISIYNYLSEKTDLIKGYYLDHTDNSVVFLTSPNISDIGKDKIYTYVESLNKKGFSIINFDKSIDYNKYEFGLHWGTEKSAMIEQDGMDGKANPQWFKLYLTSRIKYAKGGKIQMGDMVNVVDINKSGVVTNVISNGKHFSVKFVDGSKGVYDRNEIQKIMSEEDYDEFESGGDIEQGNYQMMLSQAKEVKHHADELTNILKNETEIEAWVVAKMEDVSETLSDITHYLDGKSEYEQGGTLAGNLETDSIGFAKGGEVKYYRMYDKIVSAVEKDLNISYALAVSVVDNHESLIKDMIEYYGETSPKRIAEAITQDYDEFGSGGKTHSHNHREMVDELDTHGNCVVDYDSMKNTYFWEDYKNDIYKDGFDTEEEAYESLAHHLQDKFKKGGTINSNKMARAKSKASSTGLKKAQTTRWTAYTTKAGQTKHKVEDKPYKVSSDKKRPATPSGYRFSKVAEEKGITNNRFRRPTKAEIEKYANKKTKSGQLIMYKENRKNKVDLNPKSRI